MFELNGKYNNCKVFTDNCDKETISQLTTLLNQESVKDSQIRIMPDTHAGKGCVIGTTMTIQNTVIPNLVGVDIGCGMLAIKLNETDIDLKQLDKVIEDYVPSGFNIHEHAIANYPDLSSIKAPIDINRAKKSLGTLGGGNHFIEVDRDSIGNLWLVIHTGSRHLGIEVCKYYQDKAYHQIKSIDIKDKINKTISRLKAEGKTSDIENSIKILKMQEPHIPKDLCYLKEQDFKDYLWDMNITQKYASINRFIIAKSIINHMNLRQMEFFETIHNYIDLDNMILRKGAVSAKLNEKLIIPMNMRDGSLICYGKGNPDWNYSAPHGAGRIMSRGQAKDKVSMDEFVSSMKDIYSTSVVQSTIDEAPMVYKPMQEIVDNIQDTVDIVDIIKPIYNFKAH